MYSSSSGFSSCLVGIDRPPCAFGLVEHCVAGEKVEVKSFVTHTQAQPHPRYLSSCEPTCLVLLTLGPIFVQLLSVCFLVVSAQLQTRPLK